VPFILAGFPAAMQGTEAVGEKKGFQKTPVPKKELFKKTGMANCWM